MNRATSTSIAVATWLAWVAAPVLAQQTTEQATQQTTQTVEAPPSSEPAPPGGIITTAPPMRYVSPGYLEYELEDARERSRRTRVALIATSAVFGVGIILAGVGASQCQWVDRAREPDEYLCNNAGDVLVPLGGSFALAGAIGMITSGAMLGVRNRNEREIERDIRRSYYGRRLRWDVDSGRFVF
ncbi:MAG: hypothetical protein AMJ62_16345 [Myxococcales bacterium SG8_38]|nr:MAG: hypothetical protein AMJ62_16345 [Myxococcales bacterium SG8_38]